MTDTNTLTEQATEEATEESAKLEELRDAVDSEQSDDLDDAQPEHPKDGDTVCGATRSVHAVFVTCGLPARHAGLHSAKVSGARKGIQWARRSGDTD